MGIVSAVVLINGATGSHGGHSQLHTTSMMKGVFFLSFATIAAGAGTYETELLRGIDIYNFRSKCWGKSNVDKYAVDMENAKRECMQMEPAFDFPGHGDGPQNPFLRPNSNPFEKLTRGGDFSDLQSLWRTKRDASEGLVDVDEDDFYEFLQQVQDHRHLKTNSMGNLTCVLQKIGQLTEDMEVNIEYYTTALTAEEAEYGFTFDVEGSAAKDPEWRAKIAAEYNDCHEMAQSWPATSLDETRMLTKVAPGRYKMVTKTKAGKTGDYEMNFTEHGVFEKLEVGGLTASCFYRRLGDFEGTWKVCSKVGAEGYLDA